MSGLVATDGRVVNQYRYTAFGAPEPGYPQEQTINPLRFMAREIDGSTELYYVRARWYDPVLGRFLSEDPIGLAGGINPYVYAGNDPVNNTDPTGLKQQPDCGSGQITSDIPLCGLTVTAPPARPLVIFPPRSPVGPRGEAPVMRESSGGGGNGGGQISNQQINPCSNQSIRHFGDDAFRRGIASGEKWYQRVEQGAWLFPNGGNSFRGVPIVPGPGSTDWKLNAGVPPAGVAWIVHSHLYRQAPGIVGQSLTRILHVRVGRALSSRYEHPYSVLGVRSML